MRILVVEDEPKIAQFTAKSLQEISYAVDVADSGKKARQMFEYVDYDLIVLDIMLPDDDGVKICQDFKKMKPSIPIMILSTLDQIHDKVKGFDSGADDYLTKPFFVEEFIARVRALLRRREENGLVLKCEDLEMDLVKREVKRSGQVIKLTSKEFGLLEFFLRNVGRSVTRIQIAQHVWDLNFDPESNIVDVYVKQLRKKIDHPFSKKLIKTIIGHGYSLNDE